MLPGSCCEQPLSLRGARQDPDDASPPDAISLAEPHLSGTDRDHGHGFYGSTELQPVGPAQGGRKGRHGSLRRATETRGAVKALKPLLPDAEPSNPLFGSM